MSWPKKHVAKCIFQAVDFFRVESGPTQAVLPLVGLAAEKIIRDRYMTCCDGRG
ncbi:MAG: hypothetical protein R6U98_16720 [Pirellulaceae bacterium]